MKAFRFQIGCAKRSAARMQKRSGRRNPSAAQKGDEHGLS